MVMYVALVNVIKAETNAVSVVVVQPLVRIIAKRNVPNFPRLPMYVMGVISYIAAPLRKDSIKLLQHKKSMNWCGANHVQALISVKRN